jgi:DNA-binding transcriptional ArsR family regulator
VLEADYPVDRDLRLDGRGLLLIPSVFSRRNPITLADPGLPPVLVYPVRRGPCWWAPQGERPMTGRSTLGSLLGRGRAAVLRAVEGGRTTSELARRTGVTPATASEHARILRDAGLLVSVRDRDTVPHTPTPLGTDLLAVNSFGSYPSGSSPSGN